MPGGQEAVGRQQRLRFCWREGAAVTETEVRESKCVRETNHNRGPEPDGDSLCESVNGLINTFPILLWGRPSGIAPLGPPIKQGRAWRALHLSLPSAPHTMTSSHSSAPKPSFHEPTNTAVGISGRLETSCWNHHQPPPSFFSSRLSLLEELSCSHGRKPTGHCPSPAQNRPTCLHLTPVTPNLYTRRSTW